MLTRTGDIMRCILDFLRAAFKLEVPDNFGDLSLQFMGLPPELYFGIEAHLSVSAS